MILTLMLRAGRVKYAERNPKNKKNPNRRNPKKKHKTVCQIDNYIANGNIPKTD